MAHFAQVDENNVVTQVIVVANNELLLDGVENETKGIEFCKSLLGDDTRWVQTIDLQNVITDVLIFLFNV